MPRGVGGSRGPLWRRAGVAYRQLFAGALILAITAAVGLGRPVPAHAGEAEGQPPAKIERPLILGITDVPPFAMKNSDGVWEGIAVALWQHVAQELGVTTTYRELDIADIIPALQRGSIDAFIGAAITADREAMIDFSHPYFSTGFAIAVPARHSSSGWSALANDLLSRSFLELIVPLLATLVVAGTVIWLAERKANPKDFDPRPAHGFFDGIWWAAVTMTTVGYGDKAPQTWIGRIVAFVWMMTAVVLIALFTAHVTALLTAHTMEGKIRGPGDLLGRRVGAIAGTVGMTDLQHVGIAAQGYPDLDTALRALVSGKLDAVVAPEPILRYVVNSRFWEQVSVLGRTFQRTDYGFALPPGSKLRKAINHAILDMIYTDRWRELLHRYLGDGM